MDVICLGLIVCDIMVKPVYMDVMDKDVSLVERIIMSNGGDAMNVAVNLASMGVNTGLAGRVGKDRFGEFLMETAVRNNLDTTGIIWDESCNTSTCIVLVQENGERNFLFYPGAVNNLCEADISMELLKKTKILAVGSAGLLPSLDGQGLANVLRKAQSLGVKTCMDLSGDFDEAFKEKIKLSLKYTDIFLPSDYQARYLTGMERAEDMAGKLLGFGPSIVAIKLGRNGCMIASKDGITHIPAFQVKAVDATGAGDAFVAGFIASYLRGRSDYECGRFANAAGALCVTGMGATYAARSYDEINAFAKCMKPYED